MGLNEILEQQGWNLVERQGWIAVQDPRPEFSAAFNTNRVGKIIDTCFYLTLQLPDVAKKLITQLGQEPVSTKSTNSARDATYWGFETKDVSKEVLTVFTSRLLDVLNEKVSNVA